MFCHKKSRRGTGRIKCIERCFAVDCSTWLLDCTGILSRCWLCSVDTTKLVYIGACSSTQMLILNKQLYSQLALKLPLGGAKSHHSQHWRCRCCLGRQHIHQAPLQGVSNCLSKKVPDHCWNLKTWPRRRRRKLVLSSGKPVLWVSVLLPHLGFFSNWKHEWASYRKQLSWSFWKRKK